ncbi:MAG: hypothetical protein IPI19_19285 [Ignavibacteriales bacterium]|nr:hypothetical protein [Ignavibacteriales bacterium]
MIRRIYMQLRCDIKVLVITAFLFLSELILPQAGTYYNLINPDATSFIADLKNRIRNPYTRISYDNFDETNIANFASINNGNGTRSVFVFTLIINISILEHFPGCQ